MMEKYDPEPISASIRPAFASRQALGLIFNDLLIIGPVSRYLQSHFRRGLNF
jgi:hypothetical protein